jgi:predicted ATPase
MTISQALSALESGGRVQLAAVQPELEYAFRHVLIQEATYHALVRSSRRTLHKAVGESLEELSGPQGASPNLAPVLARHFAEGGDPARALKYFVLAGRAAAERYANAEASHHFGQALEVALSGAAGSERIADLFLQLGHAFELNAQDAEAVQNYQDMEAWAALAGDRQAELAAINGRATIYVKPSVLQNQQLGKQLSERVLAMAQQLGDRPAEPRRRGPASRRPGLRPRTWAHAERCGKFWPRRPSCAVIPKKRWSCAARLRRSSRTSLTIAGRPSCGHRF